jgi:peptide chain release factor subunit 1
MIRDKETIGLLSIEASEAGIGIVSGDKFETLRVLTSGIAGKHRSGGQSARRFERLRNMELNAFYHRVADNANKLLMGEYKAKGIIVSGPGPTKNNFLKEEYLDYRLRDNIIATIDTSYAGSEGLRETVQRSEEALAGMRLMEEKKIVKKFLGELNRDDGKAIYGVKDIEEELMNASVDTIVITDDIGFTRLKTTCKNCGNIEIRIVGKEKYIETKQKMISGCIECSSPDKDFEEKDIIEYIADIALDSGAKVEVISSKTEEGRIIMSFGGIAALLRFNPRHRSA